MVMYFDVRDKLGVLNIVGMVLRHMNDIER